MFTQHTDTLSSFQVPYHESYRLLLVNIALLTDVFLIFTVSIILKYSSQIHQTYKSVYYSDFLI